MVWKLVQKFLAQLCSGDPPQMQATRIASARMLDDDSVLMVLLLGASLVTTLWLYCQQLDPCSNAGPGAGGWYLGWIYSNKNAKSAGALSANWIPLFPPIGEIDGEPHLATIFGVCSVLYVDIHCTGKLGCVACSQKWCCRQQAMQYAAMNSSCMMLHFAHPDKHMQPPK